MTKWIERAVAHGVIAGRNYQAARQCPAAAAGLNKVATAHLRRAVRILMREGERQHAIAATYLDDGVDQLATGGARPAGPCTLIELRRPAGGGERG